MPQQAQSPASATPWGKLLVLNGPATEHVLTGPVCSVGRSRSADVVINSPHCSKDHFRIFMVDDMPCIQDMSSNGTYVNGVKIHKRKISLPDRAEIEIKWDLFMVFYNQAGCALTSSDDRGMIDNRYYIFKSNVLGEGTFAKVYLAINVKTGLRLACKIFPRTRPGASIRTGDAASSAQTESIQKEISILQEINHPNIVSIHDYIEDKQAAYIFLTRMAGGELFDYIINHNGIPEYEAKFIFYQALVAVEYLHNRHIAHRDLKPENFLFESPKPFSRLILTDFGLAKMTNDYLGRMKTKCGTFSYLAPEVLEVKNTCQGYSARVDCWSLGVLLFTMLSATLPFGSDEDLAVLNHRVKHGLYSFPDKDGWDKITDSAKDLIRSLLRSNPEDRLSIEQIFEHPWIASQRDLLAKLYQKMLEKCGLSVEAVESAASSHSAAAPKRPFDEMHDSSATVSPHVRKRPVI